MTNNELYHHGIKGQKWGIRKEEPEVPNDKKENAPEEENNIKAKTGKGKKIAGAILGTIGGLTFAPLVMATPGLFPKANPVRASIRKGEAYVVSMGILGSKIGSKNQNGK